MSLRKSSWSEYSPQTPSRERVAHHRVEGSRGSSARVGRGVGNPHRTDDVSSYSRSRERFTGVCVSQICSFPKVKIAVDSSIHVEFAIINTFENGSRTLRKIVLYCQCLREKMGLRTRGGGDLVRLSLFTCPRGATFPLPPRFAQPSRRCPRRLRLTCGSIRVELKQVPLAKPVKDALFHCKWLSLLLFSSTTRWVLEISAKFMAVVFAGRSIFDEEGQ